MVRFSSKQQDTTRRDPTQSRKFSFLWTALERSLPTPSADHNQEKITKRQTRAENLKQNKLYRVFKYSTQNIMANNLTVGKFCVWDG